MSFRFLTLLLVLLWASPAWAQPPAAAETTAIVELIVEDYVDTAIERKFLILPDGTRVRIKGENRLKTGDRVKVKKAKIRKLAKAKIEAALTEAEADAFDLVPVSSAVLAAPVMLTADIVPIVFDGAAPWMALADIQAYAASNIDSLRQTISYGASGMQITVHPWISIPRPSTASCDYGGLMNAANAALKARGDVATGQRIQYWPQSYGSCGWAGIGIVGGSWSLINQNPPSAAHEFGHNDGLMHEQSEPRSGVSVSLIQYGGYNGIMGSNGPRLQHNPIFKDYLSWLPSAVQLVSASGTFRLNWYQPSPLSGIRALRVNGVPISGTYSHCYYLEARQGVGVLVWRGVCDGVKKSNLAMLLDLAPATSGTDWILDVGQQPYGVLTANGAFDGVTVQTVALDAIGADVRIIVGAIPPPVPTPIPTPTPTPTPTPVPPPTTVVLTLTASKTSVVVGESYTLTVTARDVHNIALDGQAGFMVGATCAGSPSVCTKTVTRSQPVAGTKAHTLTASAVSPRTVSITVTGSTTPPPPITPPPPPPPPPPAGNLTLTVNGGASVTVKAGEQYTLVATANSAICHSNALDGVSWSSVPWPCTGTSCQRTFVTSTPVSRTHKVTSSTATCPAVTVTVTVVSTPGGGPTPPPITPPSGSWQAIKVATTDATTINAAADGNLLCAVGRALYCSDDQGENWRAPVAITGTPLLEKPLAIKGQTVMLALVRETRGLTDFFGRRSVGDVYAQISTAGGRAGTFSTPFKVSTGEAALRVSTAISTNAVWVVWMTCHNGLVPATATTLAKCGTWDVYGRRFKAGSWGPELKLVSGAGTVIGAERPGIACSGPNCALAWMDGRDKKPACRIEGGTLLNECTEIYGKFTSDEGDTWGADRRLTNSPHYAGRPSAEMDGADIWITFDRRVLGFPNDIGLLRSSDTGASFIESLLVEDGLESTHAGLAVSGRNLVAAWQGILGKLSGDRSLSWSASEAIVSAGGVPAVGLTTDYAHVVYAKDNAIWVSRKARSTP